MPKATLFNTRIETADSTPAFRDAWKYRRCLIPADGYSSGPPGREVNNSRYEGTDTKVPLVNSL